MSGQVKAFTQAQIRDMLARGAALDGARADPRSDPWQWLAKTGCGLQAS